MIALQTMHKCQGFVTEWSDALPQSDYQEAVLIARVLFLRLQDPGIKKHVFPQLLCLLLLQA